MLQIQAMSAQFQSSLNGIFSGLLIPEFGGKAPVDRVPGYHPQNFFNLICDLVHSGAFYNEFVALQFQLSLVPPPKAAMFSLRSVCLSVGC